MPYIICRDIIICHYMSQQSKSVENIVTKISLLLKLQKKNQSWASSEMFCIFDWISGLCPRFSAQKMFVFMLIILLESLFINLNSIWTFCRAAYVHGYV